MKAAMYSRYGPPEVLEITEVQKPTPKDNEILIRIHATTVTSGDARLRRADPFFVRFFNGFSTPKTAILGNELSGVVESVGKNVTMFKTGDAVFGAAGLSLGTNAEYICLAEDVMIASKPSNLTHEEAAAIPFGGNTALHFLRQADIQPGQQVLVYGASGSLGTAGVQIAKHYGAEVTAVCSGGNAKLVASLGADKVVDYTNEDFTRSGQMYHAIFDTVGKSPFSRSLRVLRENGFYLRAIHMSPGPILGGLWASMTSSKKVVGGIATELKENILFLKKLIEAGKLKPVIDRSYPLEQIADAHRYVDRGHKKGNVVLTIAH